jgi:hypothetical protein
MELVESTFPGVKPTRVIGEFETLLSIDAARRSLSGMNPAIAGETTWRLNDRHALLFR